MVLRNLNVAFLICDKNNKDFALCRSGEIPYLFTSHHFFAQNVP